MMDATRFTSKTRCIHCSAACGVTITMNNQHIESVEPAESVFMLCDAARFSDGEDKGHQMSEQALKQLFSEAQAIHFSSRISNEELLYVRAIANQFALKLVNEEARHYQAFVNTFAQYTQQAHDAVTTRSIEQADAIVVLGTLLHRDNPRIHQAVMKAQQDAKASLAYLHPIDEPAIGELGCDAIRYEVGCEEGVIAMLAAYFITAQAVLPERVQSILDELDMGYLSGECNISEEELQTSYAAQANKQSKVLILGADLFAHEAADNIAKFAALIEQYSSYSVFIVPEAFNSVGVSKLVELSPYDASRKSIGIRCDATHRLDALLPSLWHQNGTIVNMDKALVAFEAVYADTSFSWAKLLDVLGVAVPELSVQTLLNCDENGTLINRQIDALEDDLLQIDEIEELPECNGLTIYNSNPIEQFNIITASTLPSDTTLHVSAQFARTAKLQEDSAIRFDMAGKQVTRKVTIDTSLKGMIGINPIFDDEMLQCVNTYRYKQIKIEKVS